MKMWSMWVSILRLEPQGKFAHHEQVLSYTTLYGFSLLHLSLVSQVWLSFWYNLKYLGHKLEMLSQELIWESLHWKMNVCTDPKPPNSTP